MATRDDDSFTAPPERLLQDAQARPDGDEPAWVRGRAVELLHSLDDFQVPIGGKQRLLLRLGQGSHGRRVAWLRPIVVGAILIGIGGGAIASAALTEWPAWVVRSYRKLMSTSAASQALPPAPERRTAGEPARTDLGPVAAEPAPLARPAPAPRVPAPPRRAAAEARARRPVADAPPDDAFLVVDATRALRVERDPRRARSLANSYLERQPAGALADEALAICIAAAIDHHDPDAADLSARYLARFPHGSFRGLAERTLAAPH
jgi:hypothetical protein